MAVVYAKKKKQRRVVERIGGCTALYRWSEKTLWIKGHWRHTNEESELCRNLGEDKILRLGQA